MIVYFPKVPLINIKRRNLQEQKSTEKTKFISVKSKKNESDEKKWKETCIVCRRGIIIDQCKEFVKKNPNSCKRKIMFWILSAIDLES